MIARFFIDRPIFASVLSIFITLAGGIALFTLPVAQYPIVAPPTVQVDCAYPGASAQVVAETVRYFRENKSMPLPRRLIAALKAGEKVGGDKRGKQSAALVIYSNQEYSELDLRVDDHVEPLLELARLEAVSREHWTHFRAFMPTRENRAGVHDRAIIRRRESGQCRDFRRADDAREDAHIVNPAIPRIHTVGGSLADEELRAVGQHAAQGREG